MADIVPSETTGPLLKRLIEQKENGDAPEAIEATSQAVKDSIRRFFEGDSTIKITLAE